MATSSLPGTPWTSPSTAVSVRAEKSQTRPCRASLGSIVGRKVSIKARLPCSARFISVLAVSPRGENPKRNGIFALDPDFYKIPYVEGVPVGKRLQIWNLPQNCDPDEFKQWFDGLDGVSVESVEFTDDPELNAKGIGGFIEFGTKQEACMAIVRRDGHKFKGKCVRMDFVEKRPHEREIGGRRNRPSYRSSRPVSDYNYGSTSGYARGSSSSTVSSPTSSSSSYARSGYGNASSPGVGAPASASYGGSLNPSFQSSSSSNAPISVASSTSQPSSSSFQGSNSAQPSSSSFQGSNSAQPTSTATSYPASAATSTVQANSSTASSPANMTSAGNYASSPSYGSPQSSQYGNIQSGYANTPYYQNYANSQASGIQANSSYGNTAPTQSTPTYAGQVSPASTGGVSSNQSTLTDNYSTRRDLSSESGISYGNAQVPENYSSNESSANFAGNKISSYGNYSSNANTAGYGSDADNGNTPSSAGYASNTNQPSVYSNTNAPGYGYNTQSTPSNYQPSHDYQTGYGNSTMSPSYNNPSYGSNPNMGYGGSEYGAQSFGNSEFRPPYTGNPGYGSPRPSSLNKIFVGNLPWSTDDMRLQQLFNEYGTVLEAKVVKDYNTGRSRGFGFVSMLTADEMLAAIDALDGTQLEGRPLKVNKAASRY